MVCHRFAAKSKIEITETFRNLKQYGSVDSYIDKFEETMALVKRSNPTLTGDYFLDYFISGLKDHIKRPLKSLSIYSLVTAYEHACNYDVIPRSANTSSVPSNRKTPKIPPKQPIRDNKQSAVTHTKFSGKYFRCNEPWVPGQGRVCKATKQVYLVTMEDESEILDDAAYSTPPDSPQKTDQQDTHLLLHTLEGTTPAATTFTLYVLLGTTQATALIDSGSTTTFISPKIASKAGLHMANYAPIPVRVANGSILNTGTVALRFLILFIMSLLSQISDCWILRALISSLAVIGSISIAQSPLISRPEHLQYITMGCSQ